MTADRIPRRVEGTSRVAAVLLTVCAFATACGGGASGTHPAGPGTPASVIKAARVPGLGRVLVNAHGYVLYMFVPDHRERVTCTGACAGTWPPALVPSGTRPKAGPGIRASLLGSVPDPGKSGQRVVTYRGWPLYTYLPDVKPGQATGQALDLNGGYWYVLRPSGRVLEDAPRAAG